MGRISGTWRMVLLATMLSAAGWVRAAVLNVPADYASIQAAVDAAADGDEIVIASGTYDEWLTIEGRELSLRGEAQRPVLKSVTATSSTLSLESLDVTQPVEIENHAEETVIIEKVRLVAGHSIIVSGGSALMITDTRCSGLSGTGIEDVTIVGMRSSSYLRMSMVEHLEVGDFGTESIGGSILRLDFVNAARISGSRFEGNRDQCLFFPFIVYPHWEYFPGSAPVSVRHSRSVVIEDCSILAPPNAYQTCGGSPVLTAPPCSLDVREDSAVSITSTAVEGPRPFASCVDSDSTITVIEDHRPHGWQMY